MKINILYFAIILFLLCSCNKEEIVEVELEKGRYYLEDNPNDRVQHYIYNFYKENNVILLTNPELADYRYNFLNPNTIKIVPPEQSEEVLMNGFKFMEDNFFNIYDTEFKKKYFPVIIQLADSIKWYRLGDYDLQDNYVAHNFLALANINETTNKLSADKVKEIRTNLNAKFWVNHIIGARGLIHFPAEFYKVSEKMYNEWPDDMPDIEFDGLDVFMEYIYQFGFVGYDEEYYEDMGYVFLPSIEVDLECYFKMLFSKTQEEIEDILNKSEKIRQKYNIIKDILKRDFNFDITKIQN